MNKRAIIVGSAAHVAIAETLAKPARQQGRSEALGMPYGVQSNQLPEGADPYEEFAKRLHVMDDLNTGLLPDRISIERPSPHYDEIVSELGVRIDGIDQDSVVEYCVSGRWARIGERDHRGKLIWEFDHYRARRVEDVTVEPYWRKPLSRQMRRAREARMRKGR